LATREIKHMLVRDGEAVRTIAAGQAVNGQEIVGFLTVAVLRDRDGGLSYVRPESLL
jgi:hypothetical protein